ncbi:plexin domain containing 2 precursor [Schistosoma japonicum]|nr:plexin domain containing 2 precursor [Schistosoma japonicum]
MYGWIKVFSAVGKKGVVETINTEDFLAIRWPNLSIYDGNEKEMNQKATIACTLYSNGNISVYFETIPTGMIMNSGNSVTDNKLYFPMKIQNTAYYPYYQISSINIPISMIQSGTRMEFIPNPICSEQTSCNACLRDGVFDRKCYWCPNIEKCTTMYDTNRKFWISGYCPIENLTNCPMPLSVKINSNENSLHSQTTSPVHYNNVNLSMKFIQANLLNDTRGSRTDRTVHNNMDYVILLLYYIIHHKYYLFTLLIVVSLSIILVVVCIVLCNSCLMYVDK